jgi:putative Holliday junction resolvase
VTLRILAVDHGEARAGLAISDPTGTLATPIDAVEPPDPGEIAAIASGYEAEMIVVGLPKSLSGEEGHQAAVTRRFAEELSSAWDRPIELYDERFTTRMASLTRRTTGSKADEDSIAAAHLLEGFLDALRAREERSD